MIGKSETTYKKKGYYKQSGRKTYMVRLTIDGERICRGTGFTLEKDVKEYLKYVKDRCNEYKIKGLPEGVDRDDFIFKGILLYHLCLHICIYSSHKDLKLYFINH